MKVGQKPRRQSAEYRDHNPRNRQQRIDAHMSMMRAKRARMAAYRKAKRDADNQTGGT